jgi:hypothetical protein
MGHVTTEASFDTGQSRRGTATRSATAWHDGVDTPGRRMARTLGWFSIGLGLAELVAPRAMTRALGAEGHETLVQGFGLREIAAGAGLLAAENPKPWVEGRIAGDVLDLAALAATLRDDDRQGTVGLALAAVLGVTALDVWCLRKLAEERHEETRHVLDAYRPRSGYPKPAHEMRGAASDFETPRDMRNEDMRNWRKGEARS